MSAQPSAYREGGDDMNVEAETERLDRTRGALDRIKRALEGLRFGTVTAVVQDGVVVQVERTEKIRLEKK